MSHDESAIEHLYFHLIIHKLLAHEFSLMYCGTLLNRARSYISVST